MIFFLNFVSTVLGWLQTLIIIVAVLSWLVAFNVINLYNPFVRSIYDGLNAIIEPMLRPIRRMLPNFNGLDLSPLVLILIIMFIQGVVIPNIIENFLRPTTPAIYNNQ